MLFLAAFTDQPVPGGGDTVGRSHHCRRQASDPHSTGDEEVERLIFGLSTLQSWLSLFLEVMQNVMINQHACEKHQIVSRFGGNRKRWVNKIKIVKR